MGVQTPLLAQYRVRLNPTSFTAMSTNFNTSSRQRSLIYGLICFVSSFSALFATIQETDLIIVEGHRYYGDKLPSLKEAFPERILPEFVMLSTANYKGYRATWAVVQGQLVLVGIEGKIKGDGSHRLHRSGELFPEITFPHRVTSFTGTLALRGDSADYVIEGNVMRTIEGVQITFKDGKVTSTEKKTSTLKAKTP